MLSAWQREIRLVEATPEVGSMKRDGLTLGWGMASCTWIAARFPADASVQLRDDGTARVACGTQDIGTGMYTVLAKITADKTGVPVNRVEVALGDSRLPKGPISGGSMATASVVPAVIQAADNAIAASSTSPHDTKVSVPEARTLKNWRSWQAHLRQGRRRRLTRRAVRRPASNGRTCA